MQANNLGSSITKIRKAKQIPVRSIVQCGISESQYFRFVKGESSLRVESFMQLIDQLNVTLDEFLFISRNYKGDPYKILFKRIEHAFYFKQSDMLQEIADEAIVEYRKTNIEKYNHISSLAKILNARLVNQPIPIQELYTIKDYIFSLNLWSHYDLYLFINIMFAFKVDDIRFMINRIRKDTNKFSELSMNKAEVFRLVFNLIIMDLEQQNVPILFQDISLMKSIRLEDHHIIEHILLKYVLSIENIFKNQSIKLNLNNLLSIQRDLEKYNITTYSNLLKNINNFVLTSMNKNN